MLIGSAVWPYVVVAVIGWYGASSAVRGVKHLFHHKSPTRCEEFRKERTDAERAKVGLSHFCEIDGAYGNSPEACGCLEVK